MNSTILILGVLLLVGTFLLTNVFITPEQKQEIEIANRLCNLEVSGIPLGQIGQILGGFLTPESRVAEKCEQLGVLGKVISMSPYIYLAGLGLAVLGLALGGKTKEVVKIIEREKSYTQEPEVRKTPKVKTNYCGGCGNKLTPNDKFCGKCGAGV